MFFDRWVVVGSLLVMSVSAQTGGDDASSGPPSISLSTRSLTVSDLLPSLAQAMTTSSTIFTTSTTTVSATSILNLGLAITPSGTAPGASTATPTGGPSQSSSIDTRTLTITLAVCLSALALILLFITLLLARRYRTGRSPFQRSLRRGATPIDDDEIATWRGNAQSMAKVPYGHARNVSSIVFKPAEGHWATPSSSPADSPARLGDLRIPPPVVARAPNARSGLTDEAIPGAVPFVATCPRNSRRLSKMASAGHIRNKSRRSNTSVNSLPEGRPSTSRSPWVEPEEWTLQSSRSGSNEKMSIPMSPVEYDDEKLGGLAPRPSKPPKISINELPGSAF